MAPLPETGTPSTSAAPFGPLPVMLISVSTVPSSPTSIIGLGSPSRIVVDSQSMWRLMLLGELPLPPPKTMKPPPVVALWVTVDPVASA